MLSVPHGAEFGVTVKPKSNMFTSTFVVFGLAHVDVPPELGVVPADELAELDELEELDELGFEVAEAAAVTVTPTPSRPFMPAPAWPGTAQRYAYLPLFLSVTVSVAD